MESAAKSIVSTLGQLAVAELQEIRGVGDKVVHLMDELSTMNAFLRMISEADQSTVDHLMREWEKQVRELAYDAEDCADIYHLRIRRPMALQLPHIIVKWPKYQLKKLLLRRALATDVKALLARTTTVSERRVRYGIDRAALPRSPWFAPVSGVSVSANTLRRADDPDDQFVGIKEQADTLAERIKAEDDDKLLKGFSIVGFGGLGKTTLAVELCRQLDADFQRQALVSVSQAFDGGQDKDMKGLLARLLKQIVKVKEGHEQPNNEGAGTSTTTTQGNQLVKLEKIDEMDVAELSRHLEEQLTGKRYLIVVDDVWSVPAWEAIRVRLPENNCSSRIIVTTRIETVAKASSVSEHLIYHMEPLKQPDSEKLFVKRVFGSTSTCPHELDVNMKNILKKCGGIPLAIVSIASLLASYNLAENIEMWETISKSIGSQMETHPTLERMSQVITLSYDYLPHHLKACMMYLSIFPEDYVIAKDRLLCRWIAEGLVAEKRGLTLFEVAEEYFNELIGRNMIQPDKLTPQYDETVEACRVHDMMLEVMVSKSRDANFVRLVGRQYGEGLSGGKIRRLSVHGNGDKDHISSRKKEMEHRHRARQGIETMNLQQVRSLTIFQSEGLERLLDRLGEFKLLRVLDLEDCKALQDKHMRYVCQLYLLRFLRLAGTGTGRMPREIGDLEYLETLNVTRTPTGGTPSTVTKLSKLERLRVDLWFLPRGIRNMKALREVDHAILEGDAQVAQEIGELQQLQVLRLRVDKMRLKNKVSHATVSHAIVSRALASSLSKTRALRSLHLTSSMKLDFLLHVSSPPPLLRRLIMSGPISRFPNWISSLKHLTEFSLGEAKLACDKVLDSLCMLPSLQSIQLAYNSCGDHELVARTTHKFPVLKILKLNLNEDHPKVVKFEQGSMRKLETLLLEFSYSDKSIVGIDNLENLREVKLKGDKYNELERGVEGNLKSLREVLLERAQEHNLENCIEVLLECAQQNMKDLRRVARGFIVKRNLENLREVPLERAVLDNIIREVMLTGNENKSLERVLKQLEDMNKERLEKTNKIKVVVEYR